MEKTEIITLFVEPSLEHCQKIAEAIDAENAREYHMVNQTAEEIFDDVQNAGGVSLVLTDGTLVGFIKMKKVLENFGKNQENVYERGGLFVFPAFRGRGYAKKLISHILSDHEDAMIYGITRVPSLKNSLEELGQKSVSKDIIPEDLLSAMKKYGEITEEDTIFVNQKLLESL